MTNEEFNELKPGDQIWWFKHPNVSYGHGILPVSNIFLVQDQVNRIGLGGEYPVIETLHGTALNANSIAGRTRVEAFANLKKSLEQWGAVE